MELERLTLRRAKIICTLGPSSSDYSMILSMAKAGMDIARLNFSHGTHDDHRHRIQLIRKVSKELDKPVSILQDLQGPKIRIGTFADGPIILQKGQKFTLTTRKVPGNVSSVSVSYESFPRDVEPGDVVLLNDGLVQLRVESVKKQDVHCIVEFGGELSDRKGINLPGRILSVPALTEKDKNDLRFGLEQGVDFVALSFVQRPEDVAEIKMMIVDSGKSTPVVAKIEKPRAVESIREIAGLSDAIMVARGDLGVEVRAEEVPPIQKRIIRICNELGKPVITATQMLDSMIHNPRPTRAEAADVANAVLDGSDAVMLSGETASGKYPLETVSIMDRIISNIESSENRHLKIRRRDQAERFSLSQTIGYSACMAADLVNASTIVCMTQTGSTAEMISRYRPSQQIIAITPREETLYRLSLLWGVRGFFLKEFKDNFDSAVQDVLQLLRSKQLVNPGDHIVMTAGLPFYRHGITNMLRIETLE